MIIETITKINFTRESVLENLNKHRRKLLIKFSTSLDAYDLGILCTDQHELRRQMAEVGLQWIVTPKVDDDFISLLKNKISLCVSEVDLLTIREVVYQSSSVQFSFEWQKMSPPDLTN